MAKSCKCLYPAHLDKQYWTKVNENLFLLIKLLSDAKSQDLNKVNLIADRAALNWQRCGLFNTPNMVYKGFGKLVKYWKPLKSPEFSVLKTLRLPLVASPYAHISWQFVIAELSSNLSVPEYLKLEHGGYYNVIIFRIDRYYWITNPRENPSLSRLEYLEPLVFPKSWVLPKFHPYRPYPYSPY